MIKKYGFNKIKLIYQNLNDPNKRIICERTKAVILDTDYGTFPNLISSNTTKGRNLTDLKIPPLSL